MGDLGSIAGSGRAPGERNGNSFQYSCLESQGQRSLAGCTVHGVAKSDMTERLTLSLHIHSDVPHPTPISWWVFLLAPHTEWNSRPVFITSSWQNKTAETVWLKNIHLRLIAQLLADLMSGEDPVPGHLLAVPSHGGERAPVFSSPLAGYQSHHGSPTLMILFNSLPKTPPPDTIAWGLGGANTQSAAAPVCPLFLPHSPNTSSCPAAGWGSARWEDLVPASLQHIFSYSQMVNQSLWLSAAGLSWRCVLTACGPSCRRGMSSWVLWKAEKLHRVSAERSRT